MRIRKIAANCPIEELKLIAAAEALRRSHYQGAAAIRHCLDRSQHRTAKSQYALKEWRTHDTPCGTFSRTVSLETKTMRPGSCAEIGDHLKVDAEIPEIFLRTAAPSNPYRI